METIKTMRKRAMRDLRKLLKERCVHGVSVYHLETDHCIRCFAITDKDAAKIPRRFMGFRVVAEFKLVGCH